MQDELGVVESHSDGYLIAGDGSDVLFIGTHSCDFFIEVVGLDWNDLLDDLE